MNVHGGCFLLAMIGGCWSRSLGPAEDRSAGMYDHLMIDSPSYRGVEHLDAAAGPARYPQDVFDTIQEAGIEPYIQLLLMLNPEERLKMVKALEMMNQIPFHLMKQKKATQTQDLRKLRYGRR